MGCTRRATMQYGMTALAAGFALPRMSARAQERSSAAQGAPGQVTEDSVPTAASISIQDLLDHGAHLGSGQKVLLIAYLDGLFGGDNLVDRQAIPHFESGKRWSTTTGTSLPWTTPLFWPWLRNIPAGPALTGC